MKHHNEVELIRELLDLQAQQSPHVAGDWERPAVRRYLDPAVFERERERIHRRLPQIAAHGSALRDPGAFLTLELAGLPLLLVRGDDGVARAYYNVCRHRGARLVGAKSGCSKRISCPYHAWTWSTDGRLIGVPHGQAGFPGLDRDAFALRTLDCEEYAGWVWVRVDAGEAMSVGDYLGELAPEIVGLTADTHRIVDCTTLEVAANWKILVEGGLEAYHFRVAHRDTIAPLFLDNLSTYRCFGHHIRSVLPRSSLPALRDVPPGDWSIRSHANLLYSLFPGSQFLLQSDHFAWIQAVPLAPDRTRMQIATLVPRDNARPDAYWRSNHALTVRTLQEDFTLGEGVQLGLASGANERLNFGRFESALTAFNRAVDEAIG